MRASAVACVRHLIEEYRAFLRTSYRFLDPALRGQFEQHLARADVVVRGPYVTLSRDFRSGPSLASLIEAGSAEPELARARWPFGQGPLFTHQAAALETGRGGRSFVVTTGTGSGKTEAFLLPVIDGIVQRRRQGVRGVQAVLLYPMNALANDQLERLRRLLRGSGLDVSFALYTGDSDAASQRLREAPAERERTTRAEIRRDPPDILLTNYKQLEFLLVRAADRAMFTPSLRFLVLDELHSYRGALATEIACLIRRLKAHAGLEAGRLVGIGTSATVASDEGSALELAAFASVLFGETFAASDVIREELVDVEDTAARWIPSPPDFRVEELADLDSSDDRQVIELAQRLTGRRCAEAGSVADRVRSVLAGNKIVDEIERVFAVPASIEDAVAAVKVQVNERRECADEQVRLEIESYLTVGSVGEDDSPPRLRPKLHTFFHGVYDVWLCLDPQCRTLVPQGGGRCSRCGGAALPAALCRTCGQDFLKVVFTDAEDTKPLGTGDFLSDDKTGFFTYQIHDLPSADEEEDANGDEPAAAPRRARDAEDRFDKVRLCTRCVCVVEAETAACPECAGPATPYLLHRGAMHSCPACGDVYTRGDIVTPLRTGTASTVSALTTHHLDRLNGEDRKVLVFADNRQDVAHQAGYTANKHRQFALRHLIVDAVTKSAGGAMNLFDLPQLLLDEFQRLRIVRSKLTKTERDRWLDALRIEAASEFTRYTRQRGSLERLGLIGVDYEFLDQLRNSSAFSEACVTAGIGRDVGVALTRVILDTMRKNRAVAFDFFQEYIDPNRKRRYRELEGEPYDVRFPDRDRSPKGFALARPDHIRKARSGSILGFYQENPKAGQPTAIHKVARRVIGDREKAKEFIRSIVPLLVDEEILERVPRFPIPEKERTRDLEVLQIAPRVIRLVRPESGFRCNACQNWSAFEFPTCPTPRCQGGELQPASLDRDNYYVRLYLERRPMRLAVAEHTAQVPAEERAQRETNFKEGRLDALICSPTLELGVDIGPLLTVLLRNAPPTPANYVQRVGRAGRRLRIGFVSTFCAGGTHDRHSFEDPLWLVAGRFRPARIRLDNPKIVTRHLRSFLLEHLESQLPATMRDFLDDLKTPSRWMPERLDSLWTELEERRDELAEDAARLLERDRSEGRLARFELRECAELVRTFKVDTERVLEAWWQRVKQLDREYQEFATIGSARQDERKAAARKRAYFELTQDPERAYTLNYLAAQGFLPAYQFPLDTFSLDPGVSDTQTLYRAATIALQEFAPGNYVYANGHKLKSIRVLFAGGSGRLGEGPGGQSGAQASGRLQAYRFCEYCDEAFEAGTNTCPRCGAPAPTTTNCVFAEAFEAEESLRIGSDEESRQKVYFKVGEHLLSDAAATSSLYPYELAPVEHRRLAPLLVTNWGMTSKRGQPRGFWLCPECGRHRPGEPSNEDDQKLIERWSENHSRFCSGSPENLILAYSYRMDCLVLSVSAPHDETLRGGRTLSPTLVTLAEALAAGASEFLELEPGEIGAFPRRLRADSEVAEIVFYETVPGGAGYAEEMARRLPEVATSAGRRLFGHECSSACYLCLKRFRNQYWHAFLEKDLVRDLLSNLAALEPVEAIDGAIGAGPARLAEALPKHRAEVSAMRRLPGTPGPRSPIEELLLASLLKLDGASEPVPQFEIRRDGRLFTVPDFAFPAERVAVFCDGFAFHGNVDTLELDAKKRNWLQSPQGGSWLVLTYWGRAITRNPDACAREVMDIVRTRGATARATSKT